MDFTPIVLKAITEGKAKAQQKLDELKANGAKYVVVDDPQFTENPKSYGTMLDLCGFAHIHLNGRNPLIRWIKKHGQSNSHSGDYAVKTELGEVRAYKAYRTGYDLYLPVELRRQEISVKVAGYQGALEVLQQHGIDGYVRSRLD